ncbi:MAG: CAP domain-containing protein [Candidatus Eremiobacteraeota bacterium]|nr:CAP domain-containing protein [Candidatus Eremiobacteraeota bacterium]
MMRLQAALLIMAVILASSLANGCGPRAGPVAASPPEKPDNLQGMALSSSQASPTQATPGDTATAAGERAAEKPGQDKASAMEKRIKELVDRERVSRGLKPLAWNEALGVLARAHSEDMVKRDFFDHTNPDGLEPQDRLKKAGIACRASAENIATNQGYEDAAAEAVKSWMGSEGHRANILDTRGYGFNETGTGIAQAPDGTWYFTQLFIKK